MADEHWQNLKQIFHAALALPASERATFVAQSSRGDDSLKQSIESLLESHEETDNFLDTPAYAAAAEMLVDHAELRSGQVVGHYKIVSLLGEGGMGRVYLAEDTKLHRPVCLKFLSSRFTANPEWLGRFEQEARAASALNNPNILTIYEIGEADGLHFIATEFIEGQTLRERLRNGIDVQRAIDVGIQIASALVAAHRVNIVHRDIKPENIMIRDEDGLVKVLDFGLAKMSVEDAAPIRGGTIHNDPSMTNPGVLMGTVAYMSPEQARGEVVDARTDVWSLGIVIYEMVSGRLPFTGSSANQTLSAIATSSLPLAELATRNLPTALLKIISKTLNKHNEQRYSSSQELLEDLKLLRESSTGATTITAATSVNNEKRISSAEYLVSQVSGHKRGALVLAVILLLAIAGGFAVYGWRAKHAVAAAGSPQIKSLAVLPFKSLDANDNYLGIGIADAVIRKIGQTGRLTVRPTSAVLKYAKHDVDSSVAARELDADAILEGTVQRAGDRLRVTVNLLRISDGASLYNDKFDLSTADVLAIQDTVAQQVASRLQVGFRAGDTGQVSGKYPADPRAYEAYIRGVTSLDQRGYDEQAMPQMLETVNFFKKALEIDPEYALPHAQLAFAYVWIAEFIQRSEPKWADLARAEIKAANELSPNLAETHIAQAMLLWSQYEGYQNAAALRELRLAKQLDPNITNPALPALYGHIGLDDLAAQETKRELQIDPTSQSLKVMPIILAYLRTDPDAYAAEHRNLGEERFDNDTNAGWYYMRKGRLDEAQKIVNARLQRNPPDPTYLLVLQAQLYALKGDFATAETSVVSLLAKIPASEDRHHYTYDAACIYALAGNSSAAVRWLKETANSGFPNYPLFQRDPYLNRIRQAPEFIQFMSEQKAQWEKYREEFGS